MNSNPQIEMAHKAAERGAREFGYSDYAELNKSGNEPAKRAVRAAFDKALVDYLPNEPVLLLCI